VNDVHRHHDQRHPSDSHPALLRSQDQESLAEPRKREDRADRYDRRVGAIELTEILASQRIDTHLLQCACRLPEQALQRTICDVPKMDRPSEERLIRMAFDSAPIQRLDSDLGRRRVTVLHESTPDHLLELLTPLKYSARFSETSAAPADPLPAPVADGSERTTLMVRFAMNATMFAVELVAGWLAQSDR